MYQQVWLDFDRFIICYIFYWFRLIFRNQSSRKIAQCRGQNYYQNSKTTDNLMIQTVAIYTAIGAIVGLSQSAGMGGGALVNVLLMMGLGYTSRQSIPITYIFLMGGGLASTLASLRKKSLDGKMLIQTSLVVSTLPTMMCGAIVGTIVNEFLSEFIIAISFIFLTCYLLKTVISNIREKQLNKNQSESFKSTVETDQVSSVKSEIIVLNTQITNKIGQKQKSVFSLSRIKIALHIYAYTFITIIMKGSKTVDSLIGLEKCSIGTWICVFFHVAISFLYAKSLGYKLIAEDDERQKLGYVFDVNEKMHSTKVKYGMGIGFAAGLLGGALSIGGGVVLVPLWLKIGIDKNTAISSTGPLMFLSASTSFLVSVVLGKYSGLYSIFLFLGLSFISSYLIKNAVLYLVEKYNWNNLILIILSLILITSLLIFIPTQYILFTQDPTSFISFQRVC